MPAHKSPRILVADDDLGVIAAYRHVLEGDESRPVFHGGHAADALGAELFGQGSREQNSVPSWRVHFVDQGEDAIEAVRRAMAQSDPFSVIFLDIRMPPGLDGFETAQQIRRLDPHVNIVIVSGFSDHDDDELMAVAGPEHKLSFLPKPVWPDQLRATALTLCKAAA